MDPRDKRVQVLSLPLDGKPELRSMSFKEMVREVDGYIQAVPLAGGAWLYANEDGISLNLPPNPHSAAFRAHVLMVPKGLLGNLFIVRHDDGGDLADVTAEDVENWMEVE